MGCKPKKTKCGNNRIKMEDIDSSGGVRDIAGKKIVDWWYHYYSRGLGEDKSEYVNRDFMLASCKVTPDFSNYNYEPCKCHYQIGQNINIGSVVVMITTVGNQTKVKYITGYYTVKKLGNWKTIKRERWKKFKETISKVFIDRNNSLLLLDNPIKIDIHLAKKLFPKPDKKNYWKIKIGGQSFIQKVSSTTKNCHLTDNQKKIILCELKKRYKQGSKNYLGKRYLQLIKKVNGK